MTANRTWRVGKKLGRTLYINEEFAGVMDSPAVAAEIVAAMNWMSEIDDVPAEAGLTWCEGCDGYH
jgi:hypothetical protein